MALNIENSCDVEDLIEEVCRVSGKKYDKVEKKFFKYHIYPQSRKTYICKGQDGKVIDSVKEKDLWLENALIQILDETCIDGVYITESI